MRKRNAAQRGASEPLTLDDQNQDASVSPPLRGKEHPPAEMDGIKPALDDEVRRFHHHPQDAGATAFAFDPEAADAAADLAGDLGVTFLEGATQGGVPNHAAVDLKGEEEELPFVIEELDDSSGEEERLP